MEENSVLLRELRDEQARQLWQTLLSRWVTPRYVDKPIKTIEIREVVVKEKQMVTRIEMPPMPPTVIGAIVGVGLLTLILLAISAVLGLIILLVGGGGVAAYASTVMKKVPVEREVLVDVKRQIEEEVDTGRTEKTRVPHVEKVVAVGKGGLKVKSVSIDAGRTILIGPPEWNTTVNWEVEELDDVDPVIAQITEKKLFDTGIPYVLSPEQWSFPINNPVEGTMEARLRGEEGEMRECFESLDKNLQNKHMKSFRLRVASSATLGEWITAAASSDFEPEAENEIENLVGWLESMDGTYLETMLSQWLNTWRNRVTVLDDVRYQSIMKRLTPISLNLSTVIQYSAFNFYCPYCNRQKGEDFLDRDYSLENEQEHQPLDMSPNTRCHYLPKEDQWLCPSCQQTSQAPIPVHKTLDEVLMPAYDKLIEENKVERLKAHKDAREKMIQYQNEHEKEGEGALYDQLSKALSLSDEMERLSAEIEGQKQAIESMKQVARIYSDKQSTVLEQISRKGEQVAQEIIQRTTRVMESMERYKAQQVSMMERDMMNLASLKQIETEKRDQVQRDILKNSIEQNETLKQVGNKIDRLSENTIKTNATLAAGFKGLGANTRKRGIMGTFENIKDGFTEFGGAIAGKSESEIEQQKIANDG